MIQELVLECFDCLRRFCTCGCEPKEGRCVKCDRILCGPCIKEAHRDRRGMCGECYHPAPKDDDLEEYDSEGYKTTGFGYIPRAYDRLRQNVSRKPIKK